MPAKPKARPLRRSAAPAADASASLADQAHRALMNMILEGQLGPNEVVAERQIAAQLGISRTPLREAVRRLEGERLLERQRGGALVVRALPVEEFMHILNVRRLLEGEAARLAAGRIAPDVLGRLRERLDQALALPDEAALPEQPADEPELHRVIAAAAGNPVLEETIARLRTRTAMFRFGRMPERRRSVLEEHRAIIDALAGGQPETARQAMEHHIDEVRRTLLARLGAR